MTEQPNLQGETAIEKLRELTKPMHSCMLTTFSQDDNAFHSRPMGANPIDEDGAIWFMTSESSGKVREIYHNSQVGLNYAQPNDNQYVSLSGRAEVVDDRAKIHELWTPFAKAWFEGPDDPDIILIKVTPEQGEFWDDNSSRMVVFFKMALSAVTGKPYASPGSHGTLEIA